MKTFSEFVKKRRKNAEGIRQMSPSQRPNSSDDLNGGTGDKITEERKKLKKGKQGLLPIEKSNNLGMIAPMKQGLDNLTGNMVGDQINSP